jgi:hypothetical protein
VGATGTLDGKVIHYAGPPAGYAERVEVVDASGVTTWSMSVDPRVVTDPMVTASGGICVGLEDGVQCALPETRL